MTQTETEQPRKFSIIPRILNGAIAGMIAILVVFPLDLVKTRLQNQPIGPNGEREYKNMLDCFIKTYRAEGYFGMYKGAAVNISLIPMEKALKLASNDFFRFHLKTPDGKISLFRQVVAGGSAGVVQNVITTPMELLKIRMQDFGRITAAARKEGKTIEKLTATKITIQLMKERGFLGLYKGSGATCIRDVTFSMVYFPLFAALDSMGPRRSDGSGEAVVWCNFLSGLGAGALAAWLITPTDVVKTRLQAGGGQQYAGIIDCASKTLKHEGVTAFFKGGLCRMIVIGPLFAITQAVYYFGIAESLLGYKQFAI